MRVLHSIFLPAMILPVMFLAASSPAPAFANPPEAKPPAAGEADPAAKRITGSNNYVPTFGLRAPISRGFSVSGVLAVDAGLDVPSEQTRKQVAALKPRVMSAMREAVMNYASLSYVIGGVPDADMIRARLQKAIDGVVGKGQAQVTLASVIVFPQ